MINQEKLHKAVLDKLSSVIDPETGVDVVRMRLIEDLTINEKGYVSYKFRPSSPFARLPCRSRWTFSTPWPRWRA
jgi:metal-sulfur cluster biosynthetic enzyme